MGSVGEPFSNQSIGWCCIHRLNRHDLPGVSGFLSLVGRDNLFESSRHCETTLQYRDYKIERRALKGSTEQARSAGNADARSAISIIRITAPE